MFYDFFDRTMVAKEGQLMFVPKGTTYYHKILSEKAVYMAIHFEADFSEVPKPASYDLDGFFEADYMASHLSDMWNFGTQAEKYQCISLVYSLLAYLSSAEHEHAYAKESFQIIEPAMAYLKDHIYDSELKIDKLHRLCGISDTYFRQIFVQRYDTTPKNYIIAKRVSHAKAIISSGDFHTIDEVAESVGFSDPLYFSKVFRKRYGVSPSQFNKE
jgi:AraC-like DNA-binding protein